jgi:hypothetical protein
MARMCRIRRLGVFAGALAVVAGCAGPGPADATGSATGESAPATSPAPPPPDPAAAPPAAPTTTTTEAPTTSTVPAGPPCTAVAHLGDSTSVGMISSSYLPDPAQRLDAQYARVGATEQHLEIDGARSIVETHHGSQNARDTAQRLRDAGFRGCWVFALGTTDSANVGAGSNFALADRIDRMMAVAGPDPVLWVKVKTLVPGGAWSNANMQQWNLALDEAASRYPNMRVYDWPSVVRDEWFEADGIHYTSPGYAERGRLIADALALLAPR